MEAERKAMVNQTNVQADGQFQSRTTYRIRNKVILFLESTVVSFVHSSWLPKRLHFML
jgi:centromere protein O